MIERPRMYDIIYAIAAGNGRNETLFGNGAPLAHIAFERSCVGDAFPELWFELPLAGDPWFDLHVLTSREALHADMEFSADVTGGYPDLFKWFAGASGVRQLALSYDVSRGDLDHPAVQLLVRDTRVHATFLELAGGEDAASAYRALERRLPGGWLPCYTGVFPSRPGSALHVECIPMDGLQNEYADDPELLVSHLRQVGLDCVDDIVSRCLVLARSPFNLEFQLEVLPGGLIGDTFGASVRFDAPKNDGDRAAFDLQGATGELLECIEGWGLSDERWRLLGDMVFCKRVERSGESLLASVWPAFVKLRWRKGELLDAKAYIIATIS